MVNASEITDEEKLRAWLGTRPLEDAVAIAWRAAARVFPLLSVDYKVLFPSPKTQHRNFYVLRQVFFAYCGESNHDALFIDAIEYAAGMFNSPISAAALNACSTVTLSRNTRAAFSVSRAAKAASRSEDIWNAIPLDVGNLKRHRRGWSLELWLGAPPDWFTKADAETRAIWAKEPEHWRFWIRWWDSVIEGKPLNPDLLRDIALIPDKIWQQGPGPVAKAIEEIEARYACEEPENIEVAISRLPPATSEQRQTFAQAVEQHREELPATLEAVLVYCRHELNRLQFRNAPYASLEEELEAQRQIRVLTTIHAALDRLRQEIPAEGALTPENVEKGEKLSRVYVRAFKEWPRRNAEDISDSVWRAALIGTSAALLPMIGVSPNVAVMAGTVLFGGKKIADGVKAAKDLA